MTIKEVAKAAGVSTATVSHVINETRYVSPEVAKRVKDAMEKLQYVPNMSAFTLRTNKTKAISLLIPLLVNETDCIYFSQIARGVEQVLRAKGFTTMLSNTNDNIEREIEEIKNAKNRMTDGMIITPTQHDQSFIRSMGINTPVVFIDRPALGLDEFDYVISDTAGGCRDAVSQMIALGHKKIGLLLCPQFNPDERFEGYRQALQENDITYDSNLVRTGRNTFEEGYRLGKDLLTKSKDMTAVFLATNLMAQGAMRYMHESRISVPEELSVLVFDDYEWSKLHNPPLTTIRQDAYGLGQRAAEAIVTKIAEKDTDQNNTERHKTDKSILHGTRLPLTLMNRESWSGRSGSL